VTEDEEAELLREIRHDSQQTELEIQFALERLAIALDVLAWHLAKKTCASLRAAWPDSAVIMFEPLLAWLAFRDPILFDAARKDVAATVVAVGVDPRDQDAAALVSKLLTVERPNQRRRGGDNLARDCLILVAAQIGADWAGWDRNTSKNDGEYNSSSIAKGLCDALNAHPYLSQCPEGVPTEDTIRSVWNARHQKLRKAGAPATLLDDAFAYSASV